MHFLRNQSTTGAGAGTRPRSLSVSEPTSATDESPPPRAPQEISSNTPRLHSLAQANGSQPEKIQGRGTKRTSDHPDSPPVPTHAGKRPRVLLLTKVRQSFHHKDPTPKPDSPAPDSPMPNCAVPRSHAQLASKLEKIQKKLSAVCKDLNPNDPQWKGLFIMLELAIELCNTTSRFEAKSAQPELRQFTAKLRQETLASLHTTLNQILGSFSAPKASKAKQKGQKIAQKIFMLQNKLVAPAKTTHTASANSSTKATATTAANRGPGQARPGAPEVHTLEELRSAADTLSDEALSPYMPLPASRTPIGEQADTVDNITRKHIDEAFRKESGLLQLREDARKISASTLTYLSSNPNQHSSEDSSSSDIPEPGNPRFPSFFSAANADAAASNSASRSASRSASESESGEYPLRFPSGKRDTHD